MTTRFADHLLSGILADRPAAGSVPQGTLYAADDGIVYQSDGAVWTSWAVISGGAETFPQSVHDVEDHAGIPGVRSGLKSVRVPIAFDTPGLVLPSNLTLYEAQDGDIFVGRSVSIFTAWDGTTPRLIVGPPGSIGSYVSLDVTQTDTPTGTGNITTPATSGGLFSFEYRYGAGDVILAAIHDGSFGDPDSSQGEGEITLLFVSAV